MRGHCADSSSIAAIRQSASSCIPGLLSDPPTSAQWVMEDSKARCFTRKPHGACQITLSKCRSRGSIQAPVIYLGVGISSVAHCAADRDLSLLSLCLFAVSTDNPPRSDFARGKRQC